MRKAISRTIDHLQYCTKSEKKCDQIPNCVYDGKCTDFDAESSNGYFCDDLNKLDCEFKASKGCLGYRCSWGANVCSYKLILALSAHLDAIQANSEMEYAMRHATQLRAKKMLAIVVERSHSTDSAPTVLNFHVTVQNQPANAPPVSLTIALLVRELIPRVELIGGLIINQVRGKLGVCTGFRTIFKANASKAKAESNPRGEFFLYEKVKDGCLDAREATIDPYGYDPVLLKQSPLYDVGVDVGEYYNISDSDIVRPGSGMPFGFFSRSYDQTGPIYSVFFDPNMRYRRALEFVEAMFSGGFIDKNTNEVKIGIPAFSKETGLFIIVEVKFSWDKFGSIKPSVDLSGFQPLEPERIKH